MEERVFECMFLGSQLIPGHELHSAAIVNKAVTIYTCFYKAGWNRVLSHQAILTGGKAIICPTIHVHSHTLCDIFQRFRVLEFKVDIKPEAFKNDS